MEKQFEPNEEQRQLIREAQAMAAGTSTTAHFAPAELVNRMTLEELCASAQQLEGDSASPEQETERAQEHSSLKDIHREEVIEGFRQRAESFAALVRAGLVSPPETYDQSFIFVAALEKGLSGAAVIEKLKASGCTEAVVFEVPCSIALIQFSRLGQTRQETLLSAAEELARAIPGARVIDIYDPNTVPDLLREVETHQPPNSELRLRFATSSVPPTVLGNEHCP